MDFNQIKSYLQPELDRVQNEMLRALASDIPLLEQTNKMLLSRSGKMVRPVLSLLIAKTYLGGKVTEDTIKLAATSELLHNATLLHDDVADNSNSRRGVPTIMSLLGGRASVLLGDYWLVKAVDRIMEATCSSHELFRVFTKTLGDLAEGEMLQLQKADTCNTTEEDYLRIIYSKTTSLFVATAHSSAISVAASPEFTVAAIEYATKLGQAFQIKDDILDYNGTDIGKPLGQDLNEQKITLPLLGAFVNAGPELEKEIRQKLVNISEHPEYQKEIVDFVKRYDGIGYAEQRLDKLEKEAEDAVKKMPEGQDREYLSGLAMFVIGRKK